MFKEGEEFTHITGAAAKCPLAPPHILDFPAGQIYIYGQKKEGPCFTAGPSFFAYLPKGVPSGALA
jgi:hypothetical protein